MFSAFHFSFSTLLYSFRQEVEGLNELLLSFSVEHGGEKRQICEFMDQTKSSRRVIFVGGSPRSGTTLLQNILDSHPDILGGPEFLHLPEIIAVRRKIHRSISADYIKIICSKDEVDHYLASLIDTFFLRLADKNKCKFYSEKTPMNILVFSDLIELFPEAHFIQIVRDPRAIISSMQQVKKRAIGKGRKPAYFTANIQSSISYVIKCFTAGFLAAQKTPSKVLTLMYEDLVMNPERETKKICNFLGIRWNELMLSPGNQKHLGEQAITASSGDIWYDSKMYNRNIDTKSTAKWQDKLTLGQQLRIILAFKDDSNLARCGYDFSLNSLGKDNNVLAKSYYGILWFMKKIRGRLLRAV